MTQKYYTQTEVDDIIVLGRRLEVTRAMRVVAPWWNYGSDGKRYEIKIKVFTRAVVMT